MSSPRHHLPGPIGSDAIRDLFISLGQPAPATIKPLDATAQYHSVYIITIPETGKGAASELVLRVAGNHLPRIKTENEVGVMAWVSQNTTIPIPELIAYDSSPNNAIGHEFTLMRRVEGVTLSDVYDTLDDEQLAGIIDQLIDFLSQIDGHEWSAIGGLFRGASGDVTVGRVVDEAFWQTADLNLWPEGETVDSLNIQGPYHSYVDLVIGQVSTYIRLIKIHDKLSFMRDTIPRLEAFISSLPQHKALDGLNNVKIRLAHKDLHFANMIYDPVSGKITAILDWEFSGVVPFTKWNPRRAFLWNGREDETSAGEKARMTKMFEDRCQRQGVTILKDAEYGTPLQDSMQAVADYLRAITEVVPRGQRDDLVGSWRDTMLEHLALFEDENK